MIGDDPNGTSRAGSVLGLGKEVDRRRSPSAPTGGNASMQTVLYVAEMELGSELAVREAHHGFPVEVLERGIGVERLVAFIGSGYYALEITVSDGDFQENFHRFLDAPEVRDLITALSPFVRSLPTPGETTADMPLATAMMLWQSPTRPDSTTV
jgi:hypothetical protein